MVSKEQYAHLFFFLSVSRVCILWFSHVCHYYIHCHYCTSQIHTSLKKSTLLLQAMLMIPFNSYSSCLKKKKKKDLSTTQVEKGREKKNIESFGIFFDILNELGKLCFYRDIS